jgi:ATP-dependent helicase HrpA
VPGLVEEKATELIRGLPKALRRNFVPAPDFARAFALAYPNGDADSVAGALGRFLAKATGVDVTALDFDEAALEPHLRMNLRVGEAEGRGFRVLGQSRSLDELKARFGAEAEKAFAARAGERLAREGLREFPVEPIPVEIAGAGGLPAFPALVLDGEDVALRVLAAREAAATAHAGGVVRLAEIALADAVKSARKQLPLNPKTAMVYTAVATAEQLRADLAAKALAALLGGDAVADGQGQAAASLRPTGLAAIRDREAFQKAISAVKQRLFGEAMARLKVAEAALTQYAEIRPKLEAPVMGWAKANLDDLRAQLAGLVHPGFVRDTPPEAFNELPRYLKALALRAERALRDPTRDQQRMLEVQPFANALDEARRRGIALETGWQALRWDLEELRVSLFAQELGTKRPVSAKRLAKQLEALRGT